MQKTRQETILSYMVEAYIKNAEPVGSKRLCDDYGLDCSSATVRAELLDLEKKGLLIQPHTSAGRIPTEKGYRYFVERLMDEQALPDKEATLLQEAWGVAQTFEERLKSLAKIVAELAYNTVIIAYSPKNVYYTGIKNLFSQPEFAEFALVTSISTVLDELDEHLDDLFAFGGDKIEVLIGKDNPLGNRCSAITTRIADGGGVMTLLGPMRMDYGRNICLVEQAKYTMSH
ncbi:MAG TPA: hypothetical protein DDW36_00935 [Candidatus Magasanikbacteria bacterium]|nr:hypothetical protein [Candidatus Magasanikbacteria bacterium]